jgi:hypothetical protein
MLVKSLECRNVSRTRVGDDVGMGGDGDRSDDGRSVWVVLLLLLGLEHSEHTSVIDHPVRHERNRRLNGRLWWCGCRYGSEGG